MQFFFLKCDDADVNLFSAHAQWSHWFLCSPLVLMGGFWFSSGGFVLISV